MAEIEITVMLKILHNSCGKFVLTLPVTALRIIFRIQLFTSIQSRSHTIFLCLVTITLGLRPVYLLAHLLSKKTDVFHYLCQGGSVPDRRNVLAQQA